MLPPTPIHMHDDDATLQALKVTANTELVRSLGPPVSPPSTLKSVLKDGKVRQTLKASRCKGVGSVINVCGFYDAGDGAMDFILFYFLWIKPTEML